MPEDIRFLDDGYPRNSFKCFRILITQVIVTNVQWPILTDLAIFDLLQCNLLNVSYCPPTEVELKPGKSFVSCFLNTYKLNYWLCDQQVCTRHDVMGI